MLIPNQCNDSILVNEMRGFISDLAKKTKNPALADEIGTPVAYPTTFAPLDYCNGVRSVTTHMVKDEEYIYDSLGIQEGSINMFIGLTSSAKTTFVIQMVTSIMSRFLGRTSCLYFDLEGGASKQRISNVSGWNSRLIEKHIIPKDKAITIDTFFKIVKGHCDNKLELVNKYPDLLKYDTKIINADGSRKYAIVPTFVVLDSLPMLTKTSISEDEEMAGNMSAAQVAKDLKQIFTRLTQPLKQSNVILCVVNHINSNISINSFLPPATQIAYLKQGESLPGGAAPLYLSNNIFKFAAGTKFKEDQSGGYGIVGWEAKITLIKSRMNRAGREFKMIYNQETGFDRWLSALQFLFDTGFAKTSGSMSYLVGMEGTKFYKKQFIKKMMDSEEMREHFITLLNQAGEKVLSSASLFNVESQSKGEMTEDEIAETLYASLLSDGLYQAS